MTSSTTARETQTITIDFMKVANDEDICTLRFDITLDTDAAMTDFADAAEDKLYERHPDAEIVDIG